MSKYTIYEYDFVFRVADPIEGFEGSEAELRKRLQELQRGFSNPGEPTRLKRGYEYALVCYTPDCDFGHVAQREGEA